MKTVSYVLRGLGLVLTTKGIQKAVNAKDSLEGGDGILLAGAGLLLTLAGSLVRKRA